MSTDLKIKDFALKNNRKFRIEELLVSLYKSKSKVSFASAHNAIKKMIAKGEITETETGLFELAESQKRLFRAEQTAADSRLYSFLKRSFPFAQICAWNVRELAYFAHHIPTVHYTIVEAEKDVVDAVVSKLSELNKKVVLKNPTLETINHFLPSNDVIVVKNLISQAPLFSSKKLYSPRIEKILVDVLCDGELSFFRGMESVYVYQKAFDLCEINVNALKRYASRRNKLEEVESLLKDVE